MTDLERGSILRGKVQDIPNDGLQVTGEWSWTPEVKVDMDKLGQRSPTTEYSSNEDAE